MKTTYQVGGITEMTANNEKERRLAEIIMCEYDSLVRCLKRKRGEAILKEGEKHFRVTYLYSLMVSAFIMQMIKGRSGVPFTPADILNDLIDASIEG